ncbi:MAG: AI-2E family transporter, partial [Bacteroidales bacterium]|nr:AI-2E family transporter [Bacteroidales bacterium]
PHLPTLVFKLIAVFVATHLVDVFIFQPYIYSNSVKAHPLEIFLVILIAGNVAGIVGMLIAIPSYTVLRVFAREFFYRFKVVQKLTDRM